MDGDIERRPRDESLVVEIAGVNSRRCAINLAHGGWRSHSDRTKKRMQRDGDAVREVRRHRRPVERDDACLGIGEIFGEKSTAGAKTVVGVRNRQFD